MKNFNLGDMFDGMFKPVAAGCVKLGVDGKIAIKTSSGFKTFNIDNNTLTNCSNFAFDMDGMFWTVPTFSVSKGDIILVAGRPKCVIEVSESTIKTFDYENSTIAEVVPEHHVFMGQSYCYSKIFSPFLNMTKDGNMNNLMQMIMMSKMFGGDDINPMIFMMMGNNNPFANLFEGAFNFGTQEEA